MVWRVSGWPARCTWPGVGGWRNRHIGGHFGADGLQNILIWTATAAPDRTNSGIQIGGYVRVGRPIRFWDDIHGSIPARCHASQQARALLPGTEQAAVAWHHSGWIAPTGPGTRPKIKHNTPARATRRNRQLITRAKLGQGPRPPPVERMTNRTQAQSSAPDRDLAEGHTLRGAALSSAGSRPPRRG
jgi:hypothetical protein